MNELLKVLYDTFYDPLPNTELKQEVKACHQQLIEKLDKPERKLVLRIIDAKDQMKENLSMAACGCVYQRYARWEHTPAGADGAQPR